MITKIKDIVELRLGYPFRERITNNADGSHSVIQMKDIAENCRITKATIYKVDLKNVPSHHHLQNGDVIFQNRGWRNCAATVTEELPNAVASSHLLVLRTKQDVLPGYLAWYLNDARTQGQLKNLARGATIPVISKELLGKLEIEVPDIPTQQKIVALEQLRQKENLLLNEIGKRRDMLAKFVCREILQQSHKI